MAEEINTKDNGEEVIDVDAKDDAPAVSSSRVKRLTSAHSSGMEASVLKFKDLNFVVGAKDKKKNILTDVSGTVKFGRVLASKSITS